MMCCHSGLLVYGSCTDVLHRGKPQTTATLRDSLKLELAIYFTKVYHTVHSPIEKSKFWYRFFNRQTEHPVFTLRSNVI